MACATSDLGDPRYERSVGLRDVRAPHP